MVLGRFQRLQELMQPHTMTHQGENQLTEFLWSSRQLGHHNLLLGPSELLQDLSPTMMNQLMKLGTGPQKMLQLGIALQSVMHHLLAGLAQELLQELMQPCSLPQELIQPFLP